LGIDAEPVRQEVIITSHPKHDPAQPFGVVVGADPLQVQTRENAHLLIYPLVERQVVPIAAGFLGRTITGFVTTLGRNGSDYSATVIGAALDCVEVSIYTDVDGVLTADPRLVTNTRLLPNLSYAEAARLSWFGAKVLHPRTLIPIAPRNIPVRVRNTFRPHVRGTLVGPEGRLQSGASAITIRRHLALITVESTDLFGAPENAGQVFALAAHAGAAPVAICSSSGHHLSFVVEEQAADSVIELLQHDMEYWQVRCRRGLAACACIGSGFTADPMSPARAITALARERIPVITQGASELGITLIVEDQDSESALRCLHRDLIAPVIPLVRHAAKEKVRGAL
jgi:aspartate kinase